MSRSDCSFARLPNGLRIAYVEQGARNGPAVIMLHGYTDSHRSFDLLRPHLPESWRVIAMTARGHGQSDKPADGYGVTDMAADVPALLDVLNIERAIVVGHSMGAATALHVAAAYPERVAGLVLICGFADFRNNAPVAELLAEVSTFQEPVDPEFVLAFQESTFAEPIPLSFLDIVVAESLRCPAFVWREALQGLPKADILAVAQRCQEAALLIHGEKDAFVPISDQHKLREALASTRLVSLQGVGHTPHWERPDHVASLVRAFIAELDDADFLAQRVFG